MAVLEPRSFSDRHYWRKYLFAAIIGGLVACVAISIFTPATSLALSEFDQLGADGVFAIEAHLSNDVYGLYLIDTKNQTILLYKYGGTRGRGLSLLSARSFRYDRQLLDFNSGKPSPQDVRKLIKAASEPKAPDAAIPAEPEPAPKEPLTAE